MAVDNHTEQERSHTLELQMISFNFRSLIDDMKEAKDNATKLNGLLKYKVASELQGWIQESANMAVAEVLPTQTKLSNGSIDMIRQEVVGYDSNLGEEDEIIILRETLREILSYKLAHSLG